MTKINDKKNPYRLEAKNNIGEAWTQVVVFDADKLDSYWRIMKGMNRVNRSLFLQIVPNFATCR